MKKRQRPVKLHPFIKQAIRAKWRSETVKADIHSLMGENKEKLMAYAMKARNGITQDDRGSLHAGMLAASRILEITPEEVVNDAALMYAEHSRGYQARKA